MVGVGVRVRVGVNPNALGGEAHPQLVAVLVHHGALKAREARGQRDGLRAVLGLGEQVRAVSKWSKYVL